MNENLNNKQYFVIKHAASCNRNWFAKTSIGGSIKANHIRNKKYRDPIKDPIEQKQCD